jgi:hypothetical protein
MTDKEQLRQQWQDRIIAYRTSGLTLKAWCAMNGCSVDQMKYWLYKSKKSKSPTTAISTEAQKPRFVPLTVSPDAETPLLLRIGPAQIELRPGFDPRLLREVVKALTEAASC